MRLHSYIRLMMIALAILAFSFSEASARPQMKIVYADQSASIVTADKAQTASLQIEVLNESLDLINNEN